MRPARVAWPHGDPSDVIRSVLAQGAYRHESRAPVPTERTDLAGTILRWIITHVLRPIFHPIFAAARQTRGVGAILGVVIVIVALLALAYGVYRLIAAFTRRGARAPGTRDAVALLRPRSCAHWRERARAAARAGDFAAAIAALFAAALATLDERGIVAFDSTRTAGEYRRLVARARAPAGDGFDRLAERFVYAAYAQDVVTSEDFARAERAFDAFEPALA